jgi:WD40 repeat protein
MPIATRTFRVFVSSTFEDLKEERNALQRDVFPKLRKLCEQHGARFQAIDLRWGVRDEAALDQQTMEICRREIERCRRTRVKPNFILLLGDRYGWQPLPPRISAAEFNELLPRIPDEVRTLAAEWYRLDENAVPPERCLQPRTGEFANPATWDRVEQPLRQALANAARAAGLPEREIIKYEASATHQEILAGLGETEADRQHVFGFFRRPSGDVGPNSVRPADVAPTLRSAHAGLKPGGTPEIGTAPGTGKTDPRLEDLKTCLRTRLSGNIVEFDPGDIAKLCDAVFAHLRQAIESEAKRFEDRPSLELEVEAHDRFAEERSRIFTGRQAALATIAEYLRGPQRRPLVLYGESGSGKSAVMAKASREHKGRGRVIRRFIGASPESASGHALLTSLCREIAPGETPVDYAQLENKYKERLSVATAEQPLVLFIDALDQLAGGDPARDVTWLPPELPPYVKVIVSTTTDAIRLPAGLPIPLECMTQSEGGEALENWLREAGRTLQPWQREAVLARFERCGLPLYLKLAAEESKLWKSYAPQAECTLGEGVAGVLDTLLDRLASNTNHGPILVERSLGYLAAARYGLTEDEVLEVLTEDDVVWSDFDQRKHHEVSERRLPVVVWSRLSLDLEPYLTERAAPGGKVITFYHRQLVEHVTQRFLAGVESQARHANLARHFFAKPVWSDQGRKVPDARRAVELVFQQRSAEEWSEAEATLFDSQFLFAKVGAGMALDLDNDYQALLQEAPEVSLSRREGLRLMGGALRLSVHVVAKDPSQFASQMVGRLLAHCDKADVAKSADALTVAAPQPWLRPLLPVLHPPGTSLLRTLEGHSDSVKGVAMTPDGKRAVSASSDKTLKVWDLETGRALRALEGHSDPVNGVAVTPDGKRAVSASDDETLKVWDLETGRVLCTLEGHFDSLTIEGVARVNGVAVTPDGKRAVSASADMTLKVWNLKTGRALRTLEGGFDPLAISGLAGVNGVAVMPDGKRAVSASSDKLKVWDLETGRALNTLEGHSHIVKSVAVTPDGKRAVSASMDNTLKVWDLETGHALRTLEGHSQSVYGVAVMPDGNRAVSASGDKTLKVWDLETGRALRTLEGHSHWVAGVAVSPDGKRAVSASWDKTLKVWDLETERALRALESHSDSVNGVAVTPDGKRAVSASEDKTLKVWDLETGRVLRALEGHSQWVDGVAVTPDGKQAVSASNDHTLMVWDLERGCALRTLKGHSYGVNGVAVTPDGERVVSASTDETLKVWDLETGRALRTLKGHNYYVESVAVTPDGKRAVSASLDETLKVWDLETGRPLRTLKGHSKGVYGVAVTPDGKRAVSASMDNTLKVWNLETGRVLRRLKGHSDSVNDVAVTPDGKRAVSASDDQTLKVWDLETEAVIASFTCEAQAFCCAFAGARNIVAGDRGGRVYFLALEL